MASEMFRRAFPDWRSDGQQLIAEGDLVVETHRPRHPPRRAHGRNPHGAPDRAARDQHLPHRRRQNC
jgi:hypothetical protein